MYLSPAVKRGNHPSRRIASGDIGAYTLIPPKLNYLMQAMRCFSGTIEPLVTILAAYERRDSYDAI